MNHAKKVKRISELPLYLMLLPGVILVLIFSYVPMAGIVIAFEKYLPIKGVFHSQWVGFGNFKYLLSLPGTMQVLWNTVYIALMKIVAGLFFPIVIALLLNEIRHRFIKRTIQTLVYIPHFLSWVLLAGILVDVLSTQNGIVNQMLGLVGIKPIFFLGNKNWFPYTMVITEVWKEFGFDTIIFLAALTSIDPTLYEAAIADGANRWQQTWHVTLPGIKGIIVLMTVLSLGNVLNAGFDQIFNLYSPQVYKTGDIIDTLVYRLGISNMQFSVATAAGLFKSVVSLVLIAVSYKLAYKYADYRIF
jgi:putative aldouronate transport system permease protein